MPATATGADAYTAQYEVLRAQMAGAGSPTTAPGRRAACSVGLAVLLQDGLPAWLDAVDDLVAASSTAAPHTAAERRTDDAMAIAHDGRPAAPLAAEILPLAQQPEITRLLAALVLSAVRSPHRIPPLSRMRDGAIP